MKYIFIYWDEKEITREFSTEKEMLEFARREGDALVKIVYLRD